MNHRVAEIPSTRLLLVPKLWGIYGRMEKEIQRGREWDECIAHNLH